MFGRKELHFIVDVVGVLVAGLQGRSGLVVNFRFMSILLLFGCRFLVFIVLLAIGCQKFLLVGAKAVHFFQIFKF